MKKRLILLVILVFGLTQVQAQRRSAAIQEDAPKIKSSKSKIPASQNSSNSTLKETKTKPPKQSYWAVGIQASTYSNPFGGFSLKNTFGNNLQKLNVISLDFVNANDYRQFKSPFSYNGQPYIEGKINYLFILRPSFGKEFALLQSADDTSPALKGFITSGPSIGFESPYYVEIARNIGGRSAIYSVPYSDIFDNLYPNPAIVGTGGILDGLKDSELRLGWHLKGGINLDYRTYRGNYFSIELGTSLDYYTEKVHQIYNNQGRDLFTGAYICLYFGKTHR